MYKIEYYPDPVYTGYAMNAITVCGGAIKGSQDSEEVDATELEIVNGFVSLTNRRLQTVKLIPCQRVKAITKV